jgi:hypothetical protein
MKKWESIFMISKNNAKKSKLQDICRFTLLNFGYNKQGLGYIRFLMDLQFCNHKKRYENSIDYRSQ